MRDFYPLNTTSDELGILVASTNNPRSGLRRFGFVYSASNSSPFLSQVRSIDLHAPTLTPSSSSNEPTHRVVPRWFINMYN